MMCDKVVYKTYKEAQDAIAHVAAKQKKGMRVYKHIECGGFHIATNKTNKGMRKEANDKYPIVIPPKEKPIVLLKTKKKAKSKMATKTPITMYKPFERFFETQPPK